MPIIPRKCVGIPLPPYVCDPCTKPHMGRIQGFGFISQNIEFGDTEIIDLLKWEEYIVSGDIIIIPSVRGSVTSAPVTGDGFAERKEMYLTSNFTLTAEDPDIVANVAFWNSMLYQSNYRICYRTGDLLFVNTKSVSVITNQTVEESLESYVRNQITITWTEPEQPAIYDNVGEILSKYFNCNTIEP